VKGDRSGEIGRHEMLLMVAETKWWEGWCSFGERKKIRWEGWCSSLEKERK